MFRFDLPVEVCSLNTLYAVIQFMVQHDLYPKSDINIIITLSI
jgi:hypothetical protein